MEIIFYPFSDGDYNVYPNVSDVRIVPLIAYAEEGVRYTGTVMQDAVLIIDERGLTVIIRSENAEWLNVAEYFLRCGKTQAQDEARNLPYAQLSAEIFKDRGFIQVYDDMSGI